jgi:hypothetical protein
MPIAVVMISVIRITLDVISVVVMVVIVIDRPVESVLVHNDHVAIVMVRMMIVRTPDQQQPH